MLRVAPGKDVKLKDLDPVFLSLLREVAKVAKKKYGIDLEITSAFRPNDKNSTHGAGRAVDIRGHARGAVKTEFLHLAIPCIFAWVAGKYGIEIGVGIYPHGHKHIHLDIRGIAPDGTKMKGPVGFWVK